MSTEIVSWTEDFFDNTPIYGRGSPFYIDSGLRRPDPISLTEDLSDDTPIYGRGLFLFITSTCGRLLTQTYLEYQMRLQTTRLFIVEVRR